MLVDAMNRRWPQPLVTTAVGGEKGGGTRLTDLGLLLLRSYRDLQIQVEHAIDRAGREFFQSIRCGQGLTRGYIPRYTTFVKPFLAVVTGLLLTCATLRAGQTIQVAAAVSLRESFVEIAKAIRKRYRRSRRADVRFIRTTGRPDQERRPDRCVRFRGERAGGELSKANLIDDTTAPHRRR
jgi:hypothetical protein